MLISRTDLENKLEVISADCSKAVPPFCLHIGYCTYVIKIPGKMPRRSHKRKALSCRGTPRKRDEEQIIAKQTLHIKPLTHKEEEL